MRCSVAVNVLNHFLAVHWVGLRSVFVAFPDNTYILVKLSLFKRNNEKCKKACPVAPT